MDLLAQAFEQAFQHHQAGQLQEAELLYRQVLEHDPRHAQTLHLLGVIALQVGRNELAVDYLQQAIRLLPDFPEALNHLGMALAAQGKLTDAMSSYRQALALKPDFAEAHFRLGIVLEAQGRREEAVASFRQAVQLLPHNAEMHHQLALTLHGLEQAEEAAVHYRQAVRLQPDYAKACFNLGVLFQDTGRLEEAAAAYRLALRSTAEFPQAWNNLAGVYREQGKLAEAAACYRQAVRLDPQFAESHSNLGLTLHELGEFDEAAAQIGAALRLMPDFPDARANLGVNRLLLGDFVAGWAGHEWRLQGKRGLKPGFTQPMWDGSPLQGRTILLHAEYGLGDTLQFIRYARVVKERGGRVLLTCQPSLVPLLSRCGGIDRLIPFGEPLPPFDVYAPLLSLPFLLGHGRAEQLPAAVPYVECDPELAERWRARLAPIGGIRVGIAWQGSPGYNGDVRRSIPLRYFAPLANVPGVRLISLQKGPGSEQLEQHAGLALDLGAGLDATGAFTDSAAIMKNLDLVITSDTAIPHLAGALAVPTWLALAHIPDWRWLLDREDCPWYPTMRLFRQRRPGNWPEVFTRIQANLNKFSDE